MKDNRLQSFYVGDVEGKQPYINISPDPNTAAAQLLIQLRRFTGYKSFRLISCLEKTSIMTVVFGEITAQTG